MWWLAVALAQEPPVIVDEGPPTVIEVTARAEALRADLHAKMEELGYHGVRRGDEMVYHSVKRWKPSVHVHDDGRVEVSRSPVRFGLPGQGPWGAGGAALCVALACAHLDGQVVSKRRFRGQEAAVLEAMAPTATAWTHALGEQAFASRLQVGVPDHIAELWASGATPVEARAAVVAWGCTRTDTPEGDAVRGRIAEWVDERPVPPIEDWRAECAAVAPSE